MGTFFKDPETTLYIIPRNFLPIRESAFTLSMKLWHERSGHTGMRRLCTLHNHVNGIPKIKQTAEFKCDACQLAKATRQPFDGHMVDASIVGEIIYSDVTGPFKHSFDGHRYAITFTDAHSRYTWVLNTPRKAVQNYIKLFLKDFQRLSPSSTLVRIHSDKGKEYEPLKQLYQTIDFTTTPGYSPQLNPISERVNRTLKDPARAMLLAADLPTNFWTFAINHSTRLYNQLPHSTTGMTPTFRLTGNKPSAKHWKTFGCKAYAFIPKEKQKGMNAQAQLGIHLGCQSHGIFLILVGDGHIVESRDVTFDENNFPGRQFLNEHGILDNSDYDSSSD